VRLYYKCNRADSWLLHVLQARSLSTERTELNSTKMSWPYQFIDLTKEEQLQRRILLDRYGVYAQLSALVPIIGFQLYRLGVWVGSERSRSNPNYLEVPSSPSLKRRRGSASGTLIQKWRSTKWWLGGEFSFGQGVRGRLIGAGIWTTWLLFLCVHKTGNGKLNLSQLLVFYSL